MVILLGANTKSLEQLVVVSRAKLVGLGTSNSMTTLMAFPTDFDLKGTTLI